MEKNVDLLQKEMEDFLFENEKFEKGNNAAGTRARKSLQNMSKLIKAMRNEITEVRNARKAEKEAK
jgi:hypothetical protein